MNDLEKAVNELAALTNQAATIHTSAINGLRAQVTYLQQKITEHQTQLSELFGATPSKITERLDRTDRVLKDLFDARDAHAKRLDTEISDKLEALQGAYQEHEQRLNHLEGALRDTLSPSVESALRRLTELEACTKEHAGFIHDDRCKYNDHRNDPDAHKP